MVYSPVETNRLTIFISTLAAVGAYGIIVWAMYRSMVKNFDMTIRRHHFEAAGCSPIPPATLATDAISRGDIKGSLEVTPFMSSLYVVRGPR